MQESKDLSLGDTVLASKPADPSAAEDGGTPVGVDWLRNPVLNKGTAFTAAERDALGLRGLLPPRVFSQEDQVDRVTLSFRREPNALEQYVHLMDLQDRNETLFYRVVMEHIEEMLPIIYTPTVGRACQEYGNIFRRPRGLYITAEDHGRVQEILGHWPAQDVRVIVVTDGERILGLGDLGANGMRIPVGKLSLYTVCAGIEPHGCLPVTLDVGTNNETLLRDRFYNGLRQPRVRGEAYDAIVEEFMTAVTERWPKALIQFEDFASHNAFRLLEKYQSRVCTFNDDIQGTAAVALAGVLSALRLTRGELKDQTILLFGAGEAGIGIGELMTAALVGQGFTAEEARRRCWFVDSKGLVVRNRERLTRQKEPFAHEHSGAPDLLSAIQQLQPTVLIGVSGVAGAFTRATVESMARINRMPIIFALSNPTSMAECTAEQAYTWSGGRAIFASGSPFPPFRYQGRTFIPGQGNNAYVFPGVGLGVLVSESRHVTESMFFQAALALARQVESDDLDHGRVYPCFQRIREVSAAIALAVAEEAYRLGLARRPRPNDLLAEIKAAMYKPCYQSYA
jgi:malate dehydrogenase (oxaloacetate-decarboxylating)(NADP+)